MENVKLIYIDDNADPHISNYLFSKYQYSGMEVEYLQRGFGDRDTYESLLEDKDVKSSDIIIIDSVLFENANLENQKLTGEEFEIIVKNVFPFKEVIVVTQNDVDEDCKIIKKYDSSSDTDEAGFFEKEWKPVLDNAIDNIKLYRKLLKRIEEKNYLEKYFLEEIQQSVQGEKGYEKLTVKDIDKLINIFESVKSGYDNQ